MGSKRRMRSKKRIRGMRKGGLEERRERETRTLTGSEFEKRSGREKERA